MCPIRNINFHCDLWTGSCGRPAQCPHSSPPPFSFSNERTPSSLFLRGSCKLRKSSIGISLPPTPLLVYILLTIITALKKLYDLLQNRFIRQTNVSLVSGNIRVWCMCDRGLIVITFYFYKTDYFVSQTDNCTIHCRK
jgi:hypothetical protein